MCEILLIRAAGDAEFAMAWALAQATAMEHWGIGGFGWGVAWWDVDEARPRVYKSTASLARDSAAAEILNGIATTTALFHLRRPSRLSTVSMADTQPFLSDRFGFAFVHNGAFSERYEQVRAHLVTSGRLQGQADSAVGFALLEDCLGTGGLAEALPRVHEELEGDANLGVLEADGSALIYAGNRRNRLYSFMSGGCRIAATEIHSQDDSLFQLIFQDASEIRRLPVGSVSKFPAGGLAYTTTGPLQPRGRCDSRPCIPTPLGASPAGSYQFW